MNLPDGWSFSTNPKYLSAAQVALSLVDTFNFECVISGECCEHSVGPNCKQHVHSVGRISWIKRSSGWRCPHLAVDKKCRIYEDRPMVCRLFPLGVVAAPVDKKFIVYKIKSPTRCLSCFSGREWNVSDWLGACGFWDRVATIARLGHTTDHSGSSLL